MPGGGVRAELSIRMYRGLLGDFFLVRHTSRQRTYNMLIDCGVLQCIGVKAKKAATARGADRIKAGVVDLINDTGGRLDLVVATHQHYDHLSGFILANEAFKDIRIDKVWMAWTEDRKDDLANSYREKKNQALAALTALSRNQALAAMPGMETVTNLLQFYGPDDSPRGGALAVAGAGDDGDGDKLSGNASCEKVLEWLRLRAGPGNVDFLRPGDAKEWGLRGAFRAYVLGPPRSDKALRHLDPSKGEQREVYLASGEDIETASALAEIHGDGHAGERPEDQPFTRPHWRPYGANGVKTTATERRRLLKDPIVRLYRRKGASSRGIDDSWLGSAENLALKIDGDVNNTSLALALTLPDDRVLLFPADAQVGNWLSWSDQTYPINDDKNAPRLKIDDLLARTVVYKVGHHASHNATLRERGLELMSDPRLCAMIPVVEETAREQKTKSVKDGWAMPYDKLYTELKKRTKARIVRGDGVPAAEKRAFAGSKDVEVRYGPPYEARDPLWVELVLKA